MSEIMKSLFTNTIPTKSILSNHIDTSKMSEEYKRNAMKNFIPRSQDLPDDESISKMAYTSGKRILKEDQNITRDNDSWENVVEANKSKKTSDPNLGLNGIRVAHLGQGDIDENHTISPEMARQILEKNKNYLNKSSAFTPDAAISDYSRQELRNERRAKLENEISKKEMERIPVVKASDRDPITGIRKGIANISEVANSPKPFPVGLKSIQPTAKQQEEKTNSVIAAMELMRDHNKRKIESMNSSKSDWAEDSLSRTHERVAKSVVSLRNNQKENISNHVKIENVDPQKVAETFREYFQSKNTNLNKMSNNISEQNKLRENSIKRERSIETTLDVPSLPSYSSNRYSGTINSLMEKLPENIKKKALGE